MQTAATTSRFLTGRSSKVELTHSEILVSRGASLRNIVARHLAQTVHSQGFFVKLTNELIQLAEQDFARRDLNGLEDVSQVLMSLPVDAARQIGTYYYAFTIHRKGRTDEAKSLLGTVADSAPITYRARAIQTLGGIHHYLGQIDEALRFQLEALRMAADRDAYGLQTTLLARWELSIIKSVHGDHKGALSGLRILGPLFCRVSKRTPFYFYAYCNALAIELGEVGHREEAEAASQTALACPFASAYPEWTETRQELEAKRTSATPSVVAINRPPEAKPSSQLEPQHQPKRSRKLSFSHPASGKDSFQRSTAPIPATARATIALNGLSILNQVLMCIGPRAPPTRA